MRRRLRLLGSLPPRSLLPAEAQPQLCAAPPAPCAADGVGAAPPVLPATKPGRAEPSPAGPSRVRPLPLCCGGSGWKK